MANADQILAGSTSATNVTLRNADDGSLRIMTGATPTEVMKIDGTLSASTTNTVTNKLKISIGGTSYYILISTSGT